MKSDVHPVSTLEIWGAGTLFFCTGALTGGLLFGVFSTRGNAADVVAAVAAVAAAIGTWLIGAAANRYTKEAHAQRIAKEAVDQRHRREARLRRIDSMIFRARLAKKLGTSFCFVPEGAPTKIGEMHPALKENKARLMEADFSRVTWPSDDVASLSAPGQEIIGKAQTIMQKASELVTLCRAEKFIGSTYFEAIPKLLAALSDEAEVIEEHLLQERASVVADEF